MSANVESMAYVGKPPWHGIGFKLENAVSSEEMIRRAGLDWTVSTRPLFIPVSPTDPSLGKMPYEKMRALVRDSDNYVMGVCGPKYTPFQNSEVYEFFNKFAEAGQLTLEVGGSLVHGKWVWALAKISQGTYKILGEDENYSYLLLVSPFIWGEALNIMFTSVRVVCWNTLTEAMNKKVRDRFRYRHNIPFSEIKETAQMSVELAMEQQAIMKAKAETLAGVRLASLQRLYQYAGAVVQGYDPLEPVKLSDLSRGSGAVINAFINGPGSKFNSARETWWGAFNAVTYYYDHVKGNKAAESRLYNSWLAHEGISAKRKALELALQFAEADDKVAKAA